MVVFAWAWQLCPILSVRILFFCFAYLLGSALAGGGRLWLCLFTSAVSSEQRIFHGGDAYAGSGCMSKFE